MSGRYQNNSAFKRVWQSTEWTHFATQERDHVVARNEKGKLVQSLIDRAAILKSIPENIWMVSAKCDGTRITISCQVTRSHAPELRKWKVDLEKQIKTPFVLNPEEISEKRHAFFEELGGGIALAGDSGNILAVSERWYPRRQLPAFPTRVTGVPRTDLTHMECFSVDDRKTRLAEQAISTEKFPDGTLRVWFHIADVAAAIPMTSQIGQFLLSNKISLSSPCIQNNEDELRKFREALCFHPQRKSDAISTAVDFKPDKSACYHRPVLSTVGHCMRVPHGNPLTESLEQLHGSLSSYLRARSEEIEPSSIAPEPGGIYNQLSSIFTRIVTEMMIAGNIPAAYRVRQEPDEEAQKQFSKQVAQSISSDQVDFDAAGLIYAQLRELNVLEGITFNPADIIPCSMFSTIPGEPDKTAASLTRPLREFSDLVNFWQFTAGIYGVELIPAEHLDRINSGLNSRESCLGIANRPTGTIAAFTSGMRPLRYPLTGEVSYISNGRIEVSVKNFGNGRLAIPAGYELALKSGPVRLRNKETSAGINLQHNLRLQVTGFDLKRHEWVMNLDKTRYLLD